MTPANGLNDIVTVYINGTAPNGIETIEYSEMRIGQSSVYDLMGRRVATSGKTAMKPGIYIIDGKKRIVR